MPGGKGKISEYMASLTPEERFANRAKGGKANGKAAKRSRAIRDIARLVNNCKAAKDVRDEVAEICSGLPDGEEITNAFVPVVSVFKAMKSGDIKAVEKWIEMVGEKTEDGFMANGGPVKIVIDIPGQPEDEEEEPEEAEPDG